MAVFTPRKTYQLLFFALCMCVGLNLVKAQGYGLNKLSGTVITEENKSFMATHRENIQFFDDSTSRGVLEFPIKIHWVKKSDNSTPLTVAQLHEAIKKLNDNFLPIYIRFIPLPDYNYINSDYFFQYDKSKEEELVKASNAIDKVINLYLVGSIKGDNGSCNAYTYLPMPKNNKDRIFITQKALIDGASLTRQIGHYLSLYPTHGPHEKDRTEELADGSNCKTTGDEICDTPADPRLDGRMVNTHCEYIGNIQDGNSKFFRPTLDNFMSDNPRLSCVNKFTRQQYARMLYAALNIRNYIQFPKSNFSAKQRKAMEESYGLTGEVVVMTNGYAAPCELERNLYRVNTKLFAGTGIKLNISNQTKTYIYVLEGDNQRGVTLHYPIKGDKIYFNETVKTFEVPSQGNSIFVDDLEADRNYIAVLYSKKQLPIADVVKKINEVKDDKNILQKIYYVLGDEIVTMNDLTYEKGSLKVTGLTSERSIVPIFIEYVQN